MEWTQVTREQFEIFQDHVVHNSTGRASTPIPEARR